MDDRSIQRYARSAGVLLLLTIIFGFLGEVYIPSKLIVWNDAAATARNVTASGALFRFGFASYLVEAVCDVILALVFYVLLRPVNRELALLAAFFGLVSTALYGVAELFYFAPSIILGGAEFTRSFSQDQLNGLAMMLFKFFARAGGVFMVMYGIATALRGYLIYRSGYLPRFVGALLMIAGACFMVKNLTLVLAPEVSSDLLLMPMGISALVLMLWLLIRGVDLHRWNTQNASVA